MEKLNDELLDHDEDYDLYYYEEKPFTGFSYSIHPNYPETQLYSESEYYEGKEKKRFIWFPNGQLKSESLTIEDEIAFREWNQNGQLIHEQSIENGITSMEKKWDENGNLIKNFIISKDHPYFNMLEIYRKSKQ